MISQIYLVEYGSYVGKASTYEEALELEKRYKCYTEDCGPISISADETLVISLETKQQTITPNVDFSQYQTDAKKRLLTVREFEKFFKKDIEKLNVLLKKTGGVPISCENFYLVDEIETESETEFENRFYNMNTGVIAPLSSLSVGSCICIKTVQDFVPFN